MISLFSYHPVLAIFGIDDLVYVAYFISLAATAASTAYGAYASHQAAKQSEMNAETEAQATRLEAERQRQLTAENMKRQAIADKRFRAQQQAEVSAMGIAPTVGTPLQLVFDTATQQQRGMQDISYEGDLTQRSLAYQIETGLAMGQQEAANHRMQAGATILSGMASAASQAYSMSAPKKAPNSASTGDYSGEFGTAKTTRRSRSQAFDGSTLSM